MYRVLVLAVHDAVGMEGADMAGLVSALVATLMQAGYHHTAAAGVDVINLWSSVAAVNPLQFRLSMEHARDVVAASQALAESFAVERMRQHEAEQALLAEAVEAAATGVAAADGTVRNVDALEAAASVGVWPKGAAVPSLPLASVSVHPKVPNEFRYHGEEAAAMGALARAVGTDSSRSEVSAVLRSVQEVEEGLASCMTAGDFGVDCWWHTWDESMLHA